MVKFKTDLTKSEKEKLFIEFAEALGTLRSPVEMAQFIKDLLSEHEISMLARRLQIAKLLHQGLTYQEIRETLRVGDGTIIRVQTWMQLFGDGYRTVLERTKHINAENHEKNSWSALKRKYPLYFWPQLLIEEIIKSANQRQKQRLKTVIDQMKEKTKINKELEQLLKTLDL